MAETGNYINGSDILLKVDGKAVGHCSTHTLTFNSETKDRAVKPVATAPRAAACGRVRASQDSQSPSVRRASVSTTRPRTATNSLHLHGVRARAWMSRPSSVAKTQSLTSRVNLLSPRSRSHHQPLTMRPTASRWRTTASLRFTRARQARL